MDDFFKDTVEILQAIVFAIRKGLCVWFAVFLPEAHGDGNLAGSQNIKQTKSRKEYRARPPARWIAVKITAFFYAVLL